MALADSGWQQLELTRRESCPKLFHNFTVDNYNFELLFTDLIGLWSCKSSESQIIHEAKRLKTSIDPSESKGQLEVLLSKLQQSLSQGEIVFKRHNKDDGILIQTELSLPKPLKPLIWMFELEPMGAAAMAEQILRPCLHEASESDKKIASLEEIITTKDNVIEKLLDWINTSSTDLSVIFPGITGLRSKKGHVTSKDAQKHVPGLGRFNVAAWSKQFESDSNDSKFTSSGLSTLMAGCEACPKHTAKEHEDWLHDLPTITDRELDDWKGGQVSPSKLRANMMKDLGATAVNANEKDEQTKRPAKVNSTSNNRGVSEDATSTEDEFETRRGPPKLKRKRSANDNSSGSDMEEPDTKKSKLGSLRQQKPGSNSNRPKSNTNASTARSKQSDRSGSEAEGSSTASGSPKPNKNDDLHKSGRVRKASTPKRDIAATASSSPLPPQSPLPSTPRKLGRLKNSSSAAPSPTSELPLSTPRRRLGRLGSKEPGQSQQDDRSASGTPTRRLGRVGAKSQNSQRLNAVVESSEDDEEEANEAIKSPRRAGNEKRMDGESTSTESETENAKISPRRKRDQEPKQESPPLAEEHTAEEENVKEETAAEKAQRRREELKRKIDPGMTVRKKRKF